MESPSTPLILIVIAASIGLFGVEWPCWVGRYFQKAEGKGCKFPSIPLNATQERCAHAY